MKFDFDLQKNAANMSKHGLSFDMVPLLDWQFALIGEDDRRDYGEVRFTALVPDGAPRLFAVCYTLRQDTMRVISFRKANDREIKRWQKSLESR